MDLSLTGLRVLRATAERGTFTAAAAALGYTQSAVSRQVAALERAAGVPLFERRPDGPRLTAHGRLLLRRAGTALDELDLAARELRGAAVGGRARVGTFATAGAVLLPPTVRSLRAERPDLQVTTRVSTTPALVRGLRAGTLDVAVLSSRPPHRPPDGESPALVLRELAVTRLRVAVASDGPLAARGGLTLAELADQDWIATQSRADEPQLGAWPSLATRPRVLHTAADWATKLHLVAAGCGVTTAPALLAPVLPPGVVLLPVLDGPAEVRRVVAARLPGRPSGPVSAVLGALVTAAGALDTAAGRR